jgi:DNA polymerase III subunit delta
MLYLFHGPDEFTRNEKIAALRAELGDPALAELNIAVLEGRDLSLSDIRQHADAMPFLAPKRVVVVKNYLNGLRGKAEEIETLVNYLQDLSPTTDLIFIEDEILEKRHPVLKAAVALKAAIVDFTGPEKGNLRNWISHRVQEKGAAIEPGAAELLGRLVGPDLRTLNNELEKLILYVNQKRPIQIADVQLLTPYVEESEDFGFANAIGQRNAARAYDQLHKQLEEGKHPMAILGSIATQVRGLLEVKDMAERGFSAIQIAEAKGWKSDYAAKMRLREANNFSMARLEEILDLLLQIDLSIKTGRIDSLLALDMLVARLCTSR